MPVQELDLLRTALLLAARRRVEPASEMERNRERSARFVRLFARLLERHYRASPDVRVLARGLDRAANRRDFGLHELLHDVSVVRVGHVPAYQTPVELCHVSSAIWQVESEFSMNSRQVVHDFSKLVLGQAENKLFIASSRPDRQRLLDVVLKPVARCIQGHVFVALPPHPSLWSGVPELPLWRLVDREWVPMPMHGKLPMQLPSHRIHASF